MIAFVNGAEGRRTVRGAVRLRRREAYGAEPIRRVPPIAPSTCYKQLARRADPAKRPRREKRDAELRNEVRRVFEVDLRVHGVRKVWPRLRREGFDVARHTVARLVKGMGLAGAVRGETVGTTVGDSAGIRQHAGGMLSP